MDVVRRARVDLRRAASGAALLLVLSVFGALAGGGTQAASGRQWNLSHVAPLAGGDLVYDAATGQVVLAGGNHVYLWNGKRWAMPPGPQPPTRSAAGLAYDPATREVLMFGGCCDSSQGPGTPWGDTWSWNGQRWSRVASTGPRARILGSLVYDAVSRRLLLFGGCVDASCSNGLGDTWTWDGKHWAQAPSGPGARYGQAMAYDAATRRVVMAGGCCNTSRSLSADWGDTWNWDGRRWTKAASELPPRHHSSLVYDAATGQLVLFGGIGSGSYLADTWTWDGRRWTQRKSGLGAGQGPGPRSDASAAYDPAYPVATAAGTRYGAVLLFGGRGGSGLLGDTWVWTGQRWSRLSGAGPSPRFGAALAYHPATRQVVLFGGAGIVFQDETWRFDGSRWAQVGSPENAVASVYDEKHRQVVLFGDYNQDRSWSHHAHAGGTWLWNGSTWTLGSGSGPLERSPANMGYDTWTGQVLLFGGSNQLSGTSQPLGDTWLWNGRTWSQVTTPGPPARATTSLTYDAATHQLVLFGGCCDGHGDFYSDTWYWDGRAWTQAAPGLGPSPQPSPAVVYDPATRQLLLYDDGEAPADTTWLWTGTGWAPAVTAGGPSGRGLASLAYDEATKRVVLFGGAAGGQAASRSFDGDTWNWDGKQWSQAATAGPAPRAGAALVYDSAAGKLLLWGGTGLSASSYLNNGLVHDTVAFTDSWVWDGRRWTPVGGPTPPVDDLGSHLVYDAATKQVVLFGGTRDTWTW